MRYALLAWTNFVLGIALLMGGEYYLHWRDGSLGKGTQLPEVIWLSVSILLGGVSTVMLWWSTARLQRWWLRAMIVGLQLIIGFALYVFAVLWFTFNSGVVSK